MKKYKEQILNNLLNIYERSSLYKGTSSKDRKISLRITPENLKDYFDEDNYLKKEEIDQGAKELEKLELVHIQFGKGYESHLIKRVDLNLDNIKEAYKLLKRKPKMNSEGECISILQEYTEEGFPLGEFCKQMIVKLNEKASIKKYLDIESIDECKDILIAIKNIIAQEEEVFKRNFSAKVFGDSKKLENLEKKVFRILKDFSHEEIVGLEEFNILNNPGYVYFKGDLRINLEQRVLDIGELKFGIGISSQDLKEIKSIEVKPPKVITIENLTTFNTFNESDFIAIYLGGFHNSARRELLAKIKASNSCKEFYHFGDIDCGGFRILKHLREKTGIEFLPYSMDLKTIINGRNYCKKLTQNDRNMLLEMLEDEAFKDHFEVFEYMLKENVKLEQEHF